MPGTIDGVSICRPGAARSATSVLTRPAQEHWRAATPVPLRAGVIGMGVAGRNHARALAALDGVELVGVAQTNPAPVGRQSRSVSESVAGLLGLGLDYAVVCCPAVQQEEVGLQLADAGVCALIDKPREISVDAARRLVDAFDSHGLVAGVGDHDRFNPALQSMRVRLESGELGDICRVVTRRQVPFPRRLLDTVAVLGLATCDIDVTSWLTGRDYLSVAARPVSLNGSPCNDAIDVVGHLVDGTFVSHAMRWLSSRSDRYVAVSGARGCLVADIGTRDLTFYADPEMADVWSEGQVHRVGSTGQLIRCATRKRLPLTVEHETFRDAVARVSNDIVTLAEGLRMLEASAALLQDLDLPIALPEPRRDVALHGR